MMNISKIQSLLSTSILIVALLVFPSHSHAQFKDLLKKAQGVISSPDDEVGSGLKQALEFGVNEAVDKLSADKGYLESPYKILIPEEAQTIISKVKMVPGFQDVEKQLTEKMNKAAELAAKKATPIFVDAITSLTIKDAMNILLGEKDAATRYLETETRTNLYNAFLPVIQSALDEVNARTYWRSVITAYNNIPFVRKANPALDDHVSQKALDGLFSLIQVKEEKIRGDQSQRTTDLLRKVFSKQDKR
ncbi:MAG: DUF4197 domain-containing protein [Saprospiraceae bacterium]